MKKKIIALTSVIVALLLIAGIGLAAWLFTNGGNAKTDDTPISGHTTPPVSGETTLGTLTVKTGKDYTVVFDQNSITYQSGVNTDDDGYVSNETLNADGQNFILEWDLGSSYTGTTPTIAADGDVKIYASIYVYNYNTDAVSLFVDFKQASELTGKVANAEAAAAKEHYTGTKYELTIGADANSGASAWLNNSSWTANKVEIVVNINNFLKYQTTNSEYEIVDADSLDTFNTVLGNLITAGTETAVVVVFEAVYTPAN